MSTSQRIARLLKARHYQKVLFRLEQSRLKTGESLYPEDDLPNILESQAWCAENTTKDKAAAALCSKFAGVAPDWLEKKLNRMEQMRWREEALVAAERLEIVEEQTAHLTHLGFIHYMSENTDKTEALCGRSLRLGREHGIRSAEARSLHLLGMCRMRKGQLEEARANLESALSIFRELGELRAEANVLDTLGLTYGHLEQHDRSLELLTHAVDLSREGGFRSSEGTSLANRASALSELGRLTEAREDLEQALEIANRLDDDHLRSLAFWKLAVLTTRMEGENSSRVMEMWEHALEAHRRAGDRIHELKILAGMESAVRSFLDRPVESRSYGETSTALRKLAEIHTAQREHGKAHEVYGDLLRDAEKEGNAPDRLEAWIQLGHSSILLAEHERAVHELIEARVVLEGLYSAEGSEAHRIAEHKLWLGLGQAQRHLGWPEEARRSYERARAIAEEMEDKDAKWRTEGNLGLTYTDLGQFDQALPALGKAHQFYGQSRNRSLQAHALFNLAYAHQQKGDSTGARQIGMVACLLLEQIGDPSAAEVRRQMGTWLPKEKSGLA
jgi:tetratricopeptide (TPR) repeat protein